MTQAKEKANDIGVEALKQLLTLASLVLALTITFIKDAMGNHRYEASLTFLVPLSWTFLIVCIWTAWVAIAHAARILGTGADESIGYVFAPGMKSRLLARLAQWSFALGLSMLGIFGILNFELFFRPDTQPNSISVQSSTQDSGPALPAQQSEKPSTPRSQEHP